MHYNKLRSFIVLVVLTIIIIISLRKADYAGFNLFSPKTNELTTQEVETFNRAIDNLRDNYAYMRRENIEAINNLRDSVAYIRERMRKDPVYRSKILNEMMINQYEGLGKEKMRVLSNKQLPDATKKEIISEIDNKMTEKEISISMLLSTQAMERATNSMVFLTWVLVFVGVAQCGFLAYTIYMQHHQRNNG